MYGVVTYSDPATQDNVEASNATCRPASESHFLPGRTMVTCTASDTSNNLASCTFDIEINDNESPVVTCPTSVTVEIERGDGPQEITSVFPLPTDNDRVRQQYLLINVTTEVSVLAPDYTDFYPIGVTTHQLVAEDASGNRVSCSWTVRVKEVGDFDPPTIHNCPEISFDVNTTLNKDTGVIDWTPNVTDNVGIDITGYVPGIMEVLAMGDIR